MSAAPELSPLEKMAMLPRDVREEIWKEEARKSDLPVDALKAQMARSWRFLARPKQLAPPGDWVYWFVMAGRGFGKEACVETPVPTPYGWTRLGDIKVGDLVFDESGRPCPVLETFDSTPEEAYRLWFSDGSHLDVGADHLWVTWDHRARKAYGRSAYESRGALPVEWPAWRARRVIGRPGLSESVVEEALSLSAAGRSARSAARELGVSRSALARHLGAGTYVEREPREYDDSPGPQTRSTREIVETFTHGRRDDRNHSIPVCLPLDLPNRALPLDPYVLGAWLGDGSSYGGDIAADPSDHQHWYEALAEFSPHPVKSPVLVALYGLRSVLREMGLLRNKHVPDVYLRASADQRLALLQGLMDTDGSAAASSVEFSNTNPRLVGAVVELARSLGQKPVTQEGRAMFDGRDCGPKWRVTWRPTVPVFRMARKSALVRDPGAQALRNSHRMIVRWERIAPKPMRCLTVASRHHTFLLGEAMVPTHNTLTGAQWVRERGLERKCRIALIAPTLGDVRATMVEGETGLLSVLPPDALMGQSREIAWNKSLLQLTLANGTIMQGFSSETPDRLRGPQHHYAWGEEVSSWKDASKGAAVGSDQNTTWSNMTLGLRLGDHPRACLTSTPKANKLTRDLVKLPALTLVKGSSYENRANLSQVWWDAVVAPLAGTRTGRQEIEAELLEDVEGAIWTRMMIDLLRLDPPPPELRRIVVAVDPNTTSGETSDDAGIIIVGDGYKRDEHGQRHGYVLGDVTTTRGGPAAWASAAVRAYHEFEADRIVAEKNQGGEMVAITIKSVDPTVPVKLVNASRGKRTRAEPVAALYEPITGDGQPDGKVIRPGLIHHVGVFADLEDEMTTWTGEGESPNRMDALVWGMTDLKLWTPTSQHRGGGLPRGHLPGSTMGDGLGDLTTHRV